MNRIDKYFFLYGVYILVGKINYVNICSILDSDKCLIDKVGKGYVMC